jgi:hypothetical protein
MMARPDFDAAWIPRIGKQATEELRRGRRIAIAGMTMPIFAIAGGLLIGTSTLDDVIGAVLVVVAVGYFVAFMRAQMRIAAAISKWFGIRVTGGGLPKMNPKRFDAWCRERGLYPAPKLRDSERMLWSRTGTAATSRGWVAVRPHVTGMLCITSERIMFVPARFGAIPITLPEVHQFHIGEVQSVEVSKHHPTSDRADVGRSVSFALRGGGDLTVAVDRADEALDELRALLPVTQNT